jgi:hypothetical protein
LFGKRFVKAYAPTVRLIERPAKETVSLFSPFSMVSFLGRRIIMDANRPRHRQGREETLPRRRPSTWKVSARQRENVQNQENKAAMIMKKQDKV